MRALLLILGWLSFGVGFVGVFLPVLPTTPLMLLALWCFARSSGRFHDWLFTHRLFGPPLQQYSKHGVIPPLAKGAALSFMAVSLVYVFAFLRVEFWLKALVAAGMALGAWFILSRPSAPPVKAADPE